MNVRMVEAGRAAAAAADQIDGLGAGALAAAPGLVGFDGFIDAITRLVRTRRSMHPDDYEPIGGIAELAERIGAAAGLSTNIERVTVEERFGGNGPLMAGALGALGMPVTYVGAVGERAVLPIFGEFAARCERVEAIGAPGHTLALEFADGKVMMNETGAVQAVTWERLCERLGEEALAAMCGRARLIGVVNWSLMGGVPGIWKGLRERILPRLAGPARRMTIDISDPAKRSDADIGVLLADLRLLAGAGLRVTLGLNLSEATRLAGVARTALPRRGDGAGIARCAAELRAALGLDTVTVHPREGAAAATAEEAAWMDGPFTRSPRLSTGAGDHYNAGFAFAQTHGMSLEGCLACGVAVSGAYVRDGRSPTRVRLAEFLRALPGPEESA